MGTKMSVTKTSEKKDFWKDVGFIISVIQKTPLNLFIKKIFSQHVHYVATTVVL